MTQNNAGPRLAAVMAEHDQGDQYAIVECIGENFTCEASQRVEGTHSMSDEQIVEALSELGWNVRPTLCPNHQHEKSSPLKEEHHAHQSSPAVRPGPLPDASR